MPIDVVVPYRPGCKYREWAWAWVKARYAQRHADWNIIEAAAPDGPWVKALAVMPAVHSSTADVLVIADADVWCDELQAAVDAVQNGRPWAIPHFNVHRLTQRATAARYAGQPATDTEEPPYRGFEGGGITIVRRDAALAVPMDPRFVGWGGEDASWGFALAHFYGRPWRGTADLTHFWHPPQQRMTRKHGSMASKRLFRRYADARLRRSRMTELIQEAQRCLSQPSLTSHA